MPEAVGGGRVRRAEADAEVAVPVGGDPLLRAAEAGDQVGAGDAPTQEPPPEVDRVAGDRAPGRAGVPGRLAEDPADEEDLLAGAVAAVGLEHDPATACGPAHGPGQQPEGLAGGREEVGPPAVIAAHGHLRTGAVDRAHGR